MTEYKHRMSLVVPDSLMPQANQLALIAGLSAVDVNTFTQASWKDSEGNLYSVCSTAIKPVILGMMGVKLADAPMPPHAVDADVVLAQQAMDAAIMYSGTEQVRIGKILIAIDYEPLEFFANCGLTIIASELTEV